MATRRRLTKRETYLVEKITQKLIIMGKTKAEIERPEPYSNVKREWCEGAEEALRWMLNLIIGD